MEPIIVSNSSTPAPYGRACITCARAKAKCVYQDGIRSCERCHRLNKECQPSPSVRGSGVKKKPNTKTARLEEKLDGLVSLLTAASQPPPGQAPAPDQLNASAALAQFGPSPESLESCVDTPGRETPANAPISATHDISRKDATQSSAHDVYFPGIKEFNENAFDPKSGNSAPQYQMSALFSDEADYALDIFRHQMLQYFPFMVFPETISPQDMRTQNPFLWLCIMAFTTKSSERRKILGLEIRQTIGTRIIVEGEKSGDFILGLLLYAGWGHFYVFSAPIMTHVMQLAVGMLGDLGWKRPSPKDSPCMILNYDARGNPKPFLPATRTLEDRRMAISCWSASQFVSSYFQKIDTMRWIPYYDDCLQILTKSEYASDTFLVQLVRLQLIHEKVIHTPWHDLNNPILHWLEYQPGDHAFNIPKSTASAPVSFYIKALQNELRQAREQMPAELRQIEILILYSYNIELSIHEVALSKALDQSFQRLDSLWASLQATKSWFDLFFRFPPASYVAVSMGVFSQFAHCIVALSRLSTFEHPDWNLKLARETCSLSFILDEVLDRFARVKGEANLDSGNGGDTDIFSISARRIVAIKQWWNLKLATEQSATPENTVPETAAPDAMLTGPPIDFADDSWLKDILSLDDYQFSQFLQ